MSKYSEFQERFKNLKDSEIFSDPYSCGDTFELIEDILEDFRQLENSLKFSEKWRDLLSQKIKEQKEERKEWRDFWNKKATDLNYGCTSNSYHLDTRFRLQKVIRAYDKKTHELVEETHIKNPDEKKLLELGLYGLSDGGEYSIRGKDQIEYLSQYIDFCLDKYYYYWETDAVEVEKSRKPLFGSDKDNILISDNFDEPIEDFED